MTVPLFGVLVLAAVAITAFALALPFALGASYAVAIGLFAKQSVGARLLAQVGVFLGALALFVIGAAVLLFGTMEGNAGSGVTVLGGRELFDSLVIGIPIAASPFLVVAGEIGLALRRRTLVTPDAG